MCRDVSDTTNVSLSENIELEEQGLLIFSSCELYL